jgi:hypothetical protein
MGEEHRAGWDAASFSSALSMPSKSLSTSFLAWNISTLS